MIMAMAVATCSPTMNARYGESFADTFRSLAHCPPTMAGMSTLWPRLDSGKSSVTPWISPTIPASPYVRCDMPALRSHAKPAKFKSQIIPNGGGFCRHDHVIRNQAGQRQP